MQHGPKGLIAPTQMEDAEPFKIRPGLAFRGESRLPVEITTAQRVGASLLVVLGLMAAGISVKIGLDANNNTDPAISTPIEAPVTDGTPVADTAPTTDTTTPPTAGTIPWPTTIPHPNGSQPSTIPEPETSTTQSAEDVACVNNLLHPKTSADSIIALRISEQNGKADETTYLAYCHEFNSHLH